MAEPRNLETVQNEHNQVAFQIGIERYRIDCSEKAINKLLEKMLGLNEEGSKLMKEKKENESNASNGKDQEAPPPGAGIEGAGTAEVQALPGN